jgi:hypothetical protein
MMLLMPFLSILGTLPQHKDTSGPGVMMMFAKVSGGCNQQNGLLSIEFPALI